MLFVFIVFIVFIIFIVFIGIINNCVEPPPSAKTQTAALNFSKRNAVRFTVPIRSQKQGYLPFVSF